MSFQEKVEKIGTQWKKGLFTDEDLVEVITVEMWDEPTIHESMYGLVLSQTYTTITGEMYDSRKYI